MPTISQIIHTPLSELLWGPRPLKVRDYRKVIAASNLPAPLQAALLITIRKTRLWRREKLALARELNGHFHDALVAGETSEAALEAFGDPGTAAKLIRRAKLRNRSLGWKLVRAIRWACAGLAAFYVASGLYFFSGRPRITVDYLALINAPVLATPEADRAWPLYRQALIPLIKADRAEATPPSYPGRQQRPARAEDDLLELSPADPTFSELVALIDRRQPEITAMRAGAHKPELGFLTGPAGSERDPEVFDTTGNASTDTLLQGSIIDALMPSLHHMRRMARYLAADARVALSRGEVDRWLSDVAAIDSMSRQLVAKPSTLVTNLVGLGIASLGFDEIDLLLTTKPALLSDAHLRDLAHELNGPKVAADLIDLSYERYLFYDTVQRTYTQNGSDDGRFTLNGFKLGQLVGTVSGVSMRRPAWDPTALIVSGAAPIVVASRKETVAVYDKLMGEVEANFAKPMRDTNWPATIDHIQAVTLPAEGQFRHPLLAYLFPSFNYCQSQAERTIAARDALQVAIALEIHHRRTGSYPASLAELTPALLPTPPIDPVTGGPLRYRVVDNHPLLYSVGQDRKDDGGVPPLSGQPPKPGRPDARRPNPWLAAQWFLQPGELKPTQGDWVLYPQYREAETHDEP